MKKLFLPFLFLFLSACNDEGTPVGGQCPKEPEKPKDDVNLVVLQLSTSLVKILAF